MNITNSYSSSPQVSNEEGDVCLELFTCKYCSYQTTNIDVLDEHIISHEEFLEDNLTKSEDNSPNAETNFSIQPYSLDTDLNHINISCITSPVTRKCKGNIKIKPPKQSENYSLTSYQELGDGNEKKVKYKTEMTLLVCPYCRYLSRNYQDLDKHLKSHSEPIEVLEYACSECPYTTIRKSDMTKHLLVHVKDESGPKYNCDHCSYTTIKKWCLQKHMLCHKQPFEVQMYPCHRCSYSTKRKSDLRKHMLTHENHPNVFRKDDVNITIYRCSHCSYESIKKWCLQKHMFRHKKPEETEMFHCELCSYSTNRQNSLKRHQLVHKKSSNLS